MFAVALATLVSWQPHAGFSFRDLTAKVGRDPVLIQQNNEDAIRTLVVGTWSCKAIASGINMNMMTTYGANGKFQGTLHLVADSLDLNVGVEGKWVLTGSNFQQTFTKVSTFSGALGGAPIDAAASADLTKGIMALSPDPEAIQITQTRFTLTDGEGTVTTCTR